MINKHIGLALILLSLCSCSVKEVRHSCPIYIRVLVEEFVEQGITTGGISIRSNHSELTTDKDLLFSQFLDSPYDGPASRKFAELSVLGGLVNSQIEDDILYVDYGKSADRLFAYTESFSIDADEYEIRALPWKQYCRLKLESSSDLLDDGNSELRFRVSAKSEAINIFSLEPQSIRGYSVVVEESSPNSYYVTIPRQISNEGLYLEAFLTSKDSEELGSLQYEIDLSKLFEEHLYDWKEKQLKDLLLRIEYLCEAMSISVDDWTEETEEVHI